MSNGIVNLYESKIKQNYTKQLVRSYCEIITSQHNTALIVSVDLPVGCPEVQVSCLQGVSGFPLKAKEALALTASRCLALFFLSSKILFPEICF